MSIVDKSYVNAGGDRALEGALEGKHIVVHPMFGAPYEVDVVEGEGGHGGGDPVLLNDLFGTPEADIYNRAADHRDGARSILTGIAANQAIRTGLPVRIKDLLPE